MAKQLVAFDTTSRNSNLELIASIQNWFDSHKLSSRLMYDETGKKANLFATLPAHDGSIDGGIILSGHMDVVPVDGQAWDTDPFVATQIQDRIYGRGTTDMKGFIAVVLALLPRFQQSQLKKPLHFAFSYDEEVGCRGAMSLVDDINKSGLRPEGCIVGEPTEMRPVVGHKGINLFRCQVHGRAAHSSLTPEGCNAIDYAAELICRIREFSDAIKKLGPFDASYDVPFSTVSTNMISGGNAFNTIPALCEFFFEFRNLPVVDPHFIIKQVNAYIDRTLLPKMQLEYPDAKINIAALGAVPGLEASEQDEITQFIRKITSVKETLKVAYATEAGLFQNGGIPTVVCGPGSIQQAHRANEFIEISQIRKCEAFFDELLGCITQ